MPCWTLVAAGRAAFSAMPQAPHWLLVDVSVIVPVTAPGVTSGPPESKTTPETKTAEAPAITSVRPLVEDPVPVYDCAGDVVPYRDHIPTNQSVE